VAAWETLKHSIGTELKGAAMRKVVSLIAFAAFLAPATGHADWEFTSETSKMGGAASRIAMVHSSNAIDLKPPYQGAQHATLGLRYGRDGIEAVLMIDRGHFLCDNEVCSLKVRFDDAKPRRYGANLPDDGTHTALFIQKTSRFVGALRKAQRVQIEAEFLNSGSKMLEFDVRGLGDWPKQQNSSPAKK
jgi:hypothetical protein